MNLFIKNPKTNSVTFNGGYLEVFIPKYYIDEGITTEVGDNLYTIGIFHMRAYKDAELESRKTYINMTMSLPINITMDYSTKRKDTLKLDKLLDEEEYYIYGLYPNDRLIYNTTIIQSTDAAVKFINLLHNGKLPKNIKYSEIIKLYNNALELNGTNLGVTSVVKEIIIAELYRSSNLSQPFRYIGGELGYQTIPISRLAQVNSTFTAISFEDMNQSIITSINKARSNEPETESPIEPTMKY